MSALCRSCGSELDTTFCDLGMSPLANSYIEPGHFDDAEVFYPLHVFVCAKCLLVQLPEHASAADIFSDYAYFSSVSSSWLDHARRYTVEMIERFGFNQDSRVVEIASNDGYLLQYFVEQGVPVLGVEPAANVAEVARDKGIPTEVAFFGAETATRLRDAGHSPDLMLGNNVLAHVPDLNDFVSGLQILLAPTGVITMEFPHLLQLMRFNQFDTIYHEHFSYFSFLVVRQVFANHGLRMFDVDQVPTHGGSLRIFACHAEDTTHAETPRVQAVLDDEATAGLDRLDGYSSFPEQVAATKRALLTFLIEAKQSGKSVVAYGAPAKGNTLLNACGVRSDLIDFTVDRSPHKQGRLLPGTRLPIHAPEAIADAKPDYVLILPWNLCDEIVGEMAQIREWGGRFAVPIPTLSVLA
jgi:SAM-dependent methyltransferase